MKYTYTYTHCSVWLTGECVVPVAATLSFFLIFLFGSVQTSIIIIIIGSYLCHSTTERSITEPLNCGTLLQCNFFLYFQFNSTSLQRIFIRFWATFLLSCLKWAIICVYVWIKVSPTKFPSKQRYVSNWGGFCTQRKKNRKKKNVFV